MPWPRVVQPAEIAEARWRFGSTGGWRTEGLDPATVSTIRVLSSSRDYWELHSSLTGFWSERYSGPESIYRAWALSPSQMIPLLAADIQILPFDVSISREGLLQTQVISRAAFADYIKAKRISAKPRAIRNTVRELIRQIPDRKRLDAAAVVTVDVTDQLIEECRRRFPNNDKEFVRCIRGKK